MKGERTDVASSAREILCCARVIIKAGAAFCGERGVERGAGA